MPPPDLAAFYLLIREVMRLNGALITLGDGLAHPFGLTSARWQLLGVIADTGPRTVSAIARDMGLARQSVQRLVNQMTGEGILELVDNPHHRRARLVAITARGQVALDGIMAVWAPEAHRLAAQFAPAELAETMRAMVRLRERLASIAR